MWPEYRPMVEELIARLGMPDVVRLGKLVMEQGLTPSEARPWLEPPARDWAQIERLIFEIYERHTPDNKPLPYHIVRWVEQYREKHKRPTSSLFE